MADAPVHRARAGLRAAFASGRRVTGTFVKLASPDVIELCALAGFDFVVIDLEHSTLAESDAIALAGHADRCGLPALVRIPEVDAPAVCRLLENGAAGVQLSMLDGAAQRRALRRAALFPPAGGRSVSLANRVAGFGADPLAAFLAAEEESPPLLVGQIESAVAEPLAEVVDGLDVVFVGTTDLAVNLGVAPGDERLRAAVAAVRAAATAAGTTFGGWSPTRSAADAHGLADAGYLVVGSDVQMLAAALRDAAATE